MTRQYSIIHPKSSWFYQNCESGSAWSCISLGWSASIHGLRSGSTFYKCGSARMVLTSKHGNSIYFPFLFFIQIVYPCMVLILDGSSEQVRTWEGIGLLFKVQICDCYWYNKKALVRSNTDLNSSTCAPFPELPWYLGTMILGIRVNSFWYIVLSLPRGNYIRNGILQQDANVWTR